MLIKAQSLLPEGLFLSMRCGHRPISIQIEMWNKTVEKFREINPSWSENELRTHCSKFVCPPDIIPPHSTGAAVDLSIVDSKGKLLDMGTDFGTQTKESETDCETISEKAKKNRQLFVDVMTKAGFVNFPTEWWHWSYGDRYWAAEKKKSFSFYDSK